MVKQSPNLDRAFVALSHPTRRALVERLFRGPAPVTELAKPHAMSLAAVSKHLRMLEGAGLVRRKVEGRVHTIQLEAAPMLELEQWLSRYTAFWKGSLQSLKRYVDEEG